jgi:hypothetical protein
LDPRKLKTVGGYAILAMVPLILDEPEETPAQHVLIADRSGSMHWDINPLKQALEQSLAVESLTGDPLITLISFSTDQDCTLHFSRVLLSEVMKLANPYLGQLRSIKATFLTGMSQALNEALLHIREGETTGITVFTDGYANSPSPAHENRAIEDFIGRASQIPGLFLNAVGYRNWCDWPRLNDMTNRLCGKTVQAKSFKDVLAVMRDTTELLARGARPTTTVPNQGEDFLMAVIDDRVLSSAGDLKLSGVGGGGEVLVYLVTQVEKAERGVKSVARGEEWLYGALAYAMLSLGNLRGAKEALFQSGNKTLYEDHKTALSPSAIADLLTALQGWVSQRDNVGYAMGRNIKPKHSMGDLVAAINALPVLSAELDLDKFWKTYVRRGIKSVPGVRLDDGTLRANRAEGETHGPCFLRGAEWSTSEATLNIGTVQDLRVKTPDGVIIKEVEFIRVDKLSQFRNYTLLGSGELVVRELPVIIRRKEAWNLLSPLLPAIQANKVFKPGKTYSFRLKEFSLVGDGSPDIAALIDELAIVKKHWAVLKVLNGMEAPEVSATLTVDQLAALADVHITGGLYFSPPTTAHYKDRDAAIEKGEVDTYSRYKVLVGDKDVLHGGKLLSGNAGLARFCIVSLDETTDVDGKDVTASTPQKKPKLDTYWRDDFKVVTKPRSKRAKYGAVDDIMEAVYKEMLLKREERFTEGAWHEERKVVTEAVDLWYQLIRPLVVELGCTGMMPADTSLPYEQVDAAELVKRFGVKLAKPEKEGTFFVFADGALIISVFPEVAYYSTGVEVPEPEATEEDPASA